MQRVGDLMTKQPKHSRHRIPACALQAKPEPISDRYWAEVWASTARLERQYRKAQKALEAAEKRAARARTAVSEAIGRASNRQARRQLDQVLLMVEDRRRELRQIEALMHPVGYGRDERRRTVRHEAGAITIPLGATTGEPLKRECVPVFPVIVKHFEPEREQPA